MAKKQTRRSISVNRALYDKLKAFCESAGTPMSAFTEAALEARMAPAPTMAAPQTDYDAVADGTRQ